MAAADSFNRDQFILQLSLIDGIGASTIEAICQLLSRFSIADLRAFSTADWIAHGFGAQRSQALAKGLSSNDAVHKMLDLLMHKQISWICVLDENYPYLLRNIAHPPPILYWQGILPLADRTLAIIGSRKATDYADRIINALVPSLVAHDFTIISGGALGADSMAHKATMNAGGKTVAVLGSGLLKLYPATNRKLFDAIIAQGGALVSSFEPYTDPLPEHFPQRNRIIAGLSRGCLVVQAAAKSGTRITAEYALEQGRDLFAIPGAITDPLSIGCHKLIQEGAKLVTDVDDILVEYGIQAAVPVEKIPQKLEQQTSIVAAIADAHPLLALCTQPISIDELANITNKSMTDLQRELLDLQFDGKIAQNFAGMWQRV